MWTSSDVYYESCCFIGCGADQSVDNADFSKGSLLPPSSGWTNSQPPTKLVLDPKHINVYILVTSVLHGLVTTAKNALAVTTNLLVL